MITHGDSSILNLYMPAYPMVNTDPMLKAMFKLAFNMAEQLIAPILARIMAPKTFPLIDKADFILPLPLHRSRFFRRRFNQSAELTRQILAFHGGGRIMDTKILIRKKATAPQGKKSKAQRVAAMRGAFHVPTDQRYRIKGKDVLLIDDVLTTGASLSSAARCLKHAGAAEISVSTVARV